MVTNNIDTDFTIDNAITLFNGDCFDLIKKIPDNSVDLVVSSPPYCMGKSYESPKNNPASFREQHIKLISEIYAKLKIGASLCWQIGYHVKNGVTTPLDFIIQDIINNTLGDEISHNLILRNRIIWTFGHGLNNINRFSGRHETILWYTKGKDYVFNLDDVRVPQKYPGKKSYKGNNKGNFSGNPLGKNPSDVWDIPNVKSHHVEKTNHPCQFPVVIPQRLIKALTSKGALVLDPFVGSGTTCVAAILEGRRFVGAEINNEFYEIALDRVKKTLNGEINIREDKPIYKPNPNSAVAQKPVFFA